jgi:predicted nucleic acid-binding protein
MLDAQIIMQKFDIAIYDSLFVALAINENCQLITADKKHHKKEIYNKIVYLD